MENSIKMEEIIQKLQSFEVQKMGQILCVKKVHFHKSGYICCPFIGPVKKVMWNKDILL